MPNVGRPSRGCKNCRDRKLKCDLKRPSCSQCIRSGRCCHGYRDPASMVFKDESLVVAKKAEKRYEKLARQKSEASLEGRDSSSPESNKLELVNPKSKAASSVFRHDSPLTSSSRSPTREGMVKEVVSPVEDLAIGFFISNHVSQPTIVPRGQFEWITELLSQPDTHQVLINSVSAVSLAGLAVSTKNQALMAKAYTAYGSALKMVNDSLRAKDVATKDSTLVAVIMLGMYEAFVFDKRSIEAWAKHVEGACALIRLRGKDQFNSSVARRVFHQFWGVILLVSMETRRPIPEGMLELYDHLVPSSDYKVQGRQWTTRLVHFMVDAINLSGDKTSDPIAMIAKALNLDHELNQIKTMIPKIWRYKIVHLNKPVNYVHGTSYHVYIDPWIAQMWNNLRSCRTRLYVIVREQLSKGYRQCSPPLFSREEFLEQMRAAGNVLRATAAAVCASVPQIAGMVEFPQASTVNTLSLHNTKFKLDPRGTFLNGSRPTGLHHLIWPLFAAALPDSSSKELRQFAIDTLYFVALRIGTRQAISFAHQLEEVQNTAGVDG